MTLVHKKAFSLRRRLASSLTPPGSGPLPWSLTGAPAPSTIPIGRMLSAEEPMASVRGVSLTTLTRRLSGSGRRDPTTVSSTAGNDSGTVGGVCVHCCDWTQYQLCAHVDIDVDVHVHVHAHVQGTCTRRCKSTCRCR